MNNSFNDLGISPTILKALEEMGFKSPTEVQNKAIPHILKQEDLIVMSKTGSGKTAVFGIPMLQMTDSEAISPQGLILTPTRELAVQIDNDIKQMSKYLHHKTTAVYGQHSINIELQALNKGVSIITGTPGRVFDHISQGSLKTKNIRFLVLDEADRMLDMGFLDQVVKIIKTIPKDRVTLLFSATMPPEMHRICRNYMRNPETIEIESQTMTVDSIEQVYYRVNNNEKNLQLNRLLLIERPESCMIFCNTRFAVDKVQGFLSRNGYACQALHGDIPQGRRLKTIQQFKQGEFPLLVATDVAARGIHIDSLSLVVNYDVPIEKDSYVHRIGRTGRAGNVGRAITLVTGDDIISLYEIEEHIGTMIAEKVLPTEADLSVHSAEGEKWLKANSHKVKAPRTTSEINRMETHRKPRAQNNPSRSKSESTPKVAQKSSSKKEPSQKFEKNMDKPTTNTKVSHSKVSHSKVIHTKVVQTKGHTKAGSTQTVGKELAINKTDIIEKSATEAKQTKVVQNRKNSMVKKSLLQRIFKRIFGK